MIHVALIAWAVARMQAFDEPFHIAFQVAVEGMFAEIEQTEATMGHA